MCSVWMPAKCANAPSVNRTVMVSCQPGPGELVDAAQASPNAAEDDWTLRYSMRRMGMSRYKRARHKVVMVVCQQQRMTSVWMPARCANALSVMVAWLQ